MTQRPIGFHSTDLVTDGFEGPPLVRLSYRTGQLLASRHVIMILSEPGSGRALEHLIESYRTASSLAAEENPLGLSERLANLDLDKEAYLKGFREELLDALMVLRFGILGPEGDE